VSRLARKQPATINDILEVDREARSLARELAAKRAVVDSGSRVTAKA
jgi:hypothetical protein